MIENKNDGSGRSVAWKLPRVVLLPLLLSGTAFHVATTRVALAAPLDQATTDQEPPAPSLPPMLRRPAPLPLAVPLPRPGSITWQGRAADAAPAPTMVAVSGADPSLAAYPATDSAAGPAAVEPAQSTALPALPFASLAIVDPMARPDPIATAQPRLPAAVDLDQDASHLIPTRRIARGDGGASLVALGSLPLPLDSPTLAPELLAPAYPRFLAAVDREQDANQAIPAERRTSVPPAPAERGRVTAAVTSIDVTALPLPLPTPRPTPSAPSVPLPRPGTLLAAKPASSSPDRAGHPPPPWQTALAVTSSQADANHLLPASRRPLVPTKAGPGLTIQIDQGWQVEQGRDATHLIPTRREAALAGLYPGSAASRPLGLAQTETKRVVTTEWGDTFADVLARGGIDGADLEALVGQLAAEHGRTALRTGQRALLVFGGAEGRDPRKLARLELPLDRFSVLRARRESNGSFRIERHEREVQRDLVGVAGRIEGSFYSAGAAAGMPAEAIGRFVKLFSWDVDFQRDVQPNDRFEAVFERLSIEGAEDKVAGELLFAALHLADGSKVAYRFRRDDQTFDYFGADGRPIRKSLLRTPVDGAKLSSTFGPRRHPVSGYSRQHRGIDFSAPTGTPVLAAGDGVVEVADRQRGFGNYIRIRHHAEFDTAYAHLSRFAPNITEGSRIKQGQIVGYVGRTGLTTGAHLHYEILIKGEQVDPLSVKQIPSESLQGRERRRFELARADVDAQRVIEPPRQVASRDR